MSAVRPRRARRSAPVAGARRFTVDASVFVNAFNPHETGHAESLAALAAMQERGDPVLVPALALVEVASAIARATDDSTGALHLVDAIAALPHVMAVALTPRMARDAAALAASNRLRGADAIYIAVAQRYATTLVTRDEEQRARGAAVVTCETPEHVLADRSQTIAP